MSKIQTATREQWLIQRTALLKKEKELTILRDEISQQRRDLPWVTIKKSYDFVGPQGIVSLPNLFGTKTQLIVYHFMFGEDWDQGCPSCSFWADNFNNIDIHLENRDIAFLAISSAPFDTIHAYRKRLGWNFNWLSCANSDFNYDFHVSFRDSEKRANKINYNYRDQDWYMEELPGISVFARGPDGSVYHTYSTYSRGIDMLNGAYNFIDLTPLGRQESNGMSWVKRHDEY